MSFFTGDKDNSSTDCLMLRIRTDYFIDVLRSTAFPLLLCYYSRFRKTAKVRASAMSSLYDFSLDLECQTYFRKYLRTLDGQLIEEYNACIEKWVAADPDSFDAGISDALPERFAAYRKTVSFRLLLKMRRDNDLVADFGTRGQF